MIAKCLGIPSTPRLAAWFMRSSRLTAFGPGPTLALRGLGISLALQTNNEMPLLRK